MPAADGARLRIGVSEAAEDGKVNRATCLTLALALEVPPSAVTVMVGASNSEKVPQVSGDPIILSVRLVTL